MGIFRLGLAISVLLGHARGRSFFGFPLVDREIALQTFFIISGFYMALVLNEKYTFPGRYWTFIQQRLLRLFPTYLIILFLILLTDGIVYLCTGKFWGSLTAWHDHGSLLSPGARVFMVAENLCIFGQDIVMLLRLDQVNGTFYFPVVEPDARTINAFPFLLNGPAWSLAVELCFYLVAPFLVCRSWKFQLGITLAFLALRLVMVWTITYVAYHWIYHLFPPNLFFFMAGSISYLLYKSHGEKLKAFILSHRWILIAFIFFALTYSRLPLTHSLWMVWMPTVFVMIPVLFALTSRNRIDRLLGELSFPCYLIHAHVLMFTMPALSGRSFRWLLGPASVILTMILTWIYYRLIESKTERWRENLFRKSRLAAQNTRTETSPALDSSLPSPVQS